MLLLHVGVALAPHDLWSAWSFDIAFVLPIAITAILYVLGVSTLWRRAGRGRGVHTAEVAMFGAGWLALVLALVSPVHAMGSVLFSAHMTQHELLMVVAAPLLVLSNPGVAFAWSLPNKWRAPIYSIGTHPLVEATWHAITRPWHALWIHLGALLLWHLPSLYQATLRSEAVHAAQHLSFFLTSIAYWWSVLRARGAARGVAITSLFIATIVTGAFGALLTFADSLWYPAYAATTAAWGLTPLDDQRLGGMIMWMPGGIAYLAAALLQASRWIREAERRSASVRY